MEYVRMFVAERKHKPDGVRIVELRYHESGKEPRVLAQSTMFDWGRNGAGPLALARAIVLYTFTLFLSVDEEQAQEYSADMAFSIKEKATSKYRNPAYPFEISVYEVLYFLFQDGVLNDLPIELYEQITGVEEAFKFCPDCGVNFLHPNMVMNSVSRKSDRYICNSCGQREAMEDYYARQVG